MKPPELNLSEVVSRIDKFDRFTKRDSLSCWSIWRRLEKAYLRVYSSLRHMWE